MTWGHPCCFERARRKAGAPDENRASFRTTVDICRDDWLILHKLEYTEEMRYLGRRLRQCGAVRAVLDRARALAVATAEPLPAYPEHGKVSRMGCRTGSRRIPTAGDSAHSGKAHSLLRLTEHVRWAHITLGPTASCTACATISIAPG